MLNSWGASTCPTYGSACVTMLIPPLSAGRGTRGRPPRHGDGAPAARSVGGTSFPRNGRQWTSLIYERRTSAGGFIRPAHLPRAIRPSCVGFDGDGSGLKPSRLEAGAGAAQAERLAERDQQGEGDQRDRADEDVVVVAADGVAEQVAEHGDAADPAHRAGD